MAINYLISPKVQFFNPTTGAFLAGGLLYSYVANSSTPLATYPTIADAQALTNANANPIVLSATGSAQVVLSGGTKLVLQDSLGNQVWAVDNLNIGDASNISDANGNLILSFTTTTSAVNYVNITNAATGNPPIIASAGSDTNIGLNIKTKGTGALAITANSTTLSGSLTVATSETVGGTLAVTGNTTVGGTLTATGLATFNGGLTVTGANNLIPTGFVSWFAGSAAPTNWLACDGSAVSRTTYAALFAAISTTYGAGDASTTFNLPTSARSVLVGSGGSGTATLANTVGATGGEETHVLTSGEMPAHTHTYNNPVYTTDANTAGSGNKSTSSTGGTSGSTGSGTAHNNMQPSIVMIMIIKT